MASPSTLQRLLRPDWAVNGTLAQVPLEELLGQPSRPIRALVLDVDRTLLPRRQASLPGTMRQWLAAASEQVPIQLLSNNPSRSRIAATPIPARHSAPSSANSRAANRGDAETATENSPMQPAAAASHATRPGKMRRAISIAAMRRPLDTSMATQSTDSAINCRQRCESCQWYRPNARNPGEAAR